MDIEIPPILYKYRSFYDDNHKRLLYKRELFLASPSTFKDEMDCNLSYRIPNDLYRFYYNHVPPDLIDAPRYEKRRYAKLMAKHGLLSNPAEAKRFQQEINEKYYRRFGVVSLSKRYDNNYLWENYGDNYKGFCVGLDTDILCQSGCVGGGTSVAYYDILPELDVDNTPIQNIVLNLSSKLRNPYEQEEEYRFFKRWQKDVDLSERAIVLPIECIVQIIIGKNMNENDRMEIKHTQQGLYPDAELIEL